jgi:hypothetical protein
MAIILTKNIGGTTSSATSGGVFSQTEKDNLEIELAFKTAYRDYFKEFIYSAGILSQIDIWFDGSKTVKLFSKSFLYDGDGNLWKIYTTRVIDSKILLKIFDYDIDGNLSSITASGNG